MIAIKNYFFLNPEAKIDQGIQEVPKNSVVGQDANACYYVRTIVFLHIKYIYTKRQTERMCINTK